MSKLRKSARGNPCMVRLPHICNYDPTTTVLAHIKLTGYCGVGWKPNDIHATFACSACHDVIDGRRTSSIEPPTLRVWSLEGMYRTQDWWLENGYIEVK